MTRATLPLCLLLALGGCHRGNDAKPAPASAPATPVPARSETPAHTNLIDRAGYSLAYPSDWKLDDKDEDFDLDNYFAIDAPTDGHVQFFFFEHAIDENEHLKSQRNTFLGKIFKPGAAETTFSRWGGYDGHGLELRGRMKPVGAGRVRVFAHGDKKRSFVAVEFAYDEDLPTVQPGFNQIESGFRLK